MPRSTECLRNLVLEEGQIEVRLQLGVEIERPIVTVMLGAQVPDDAAPTDLVALSVVTVWPR